MNEIYKKVSRELDITEDIIKAAYESFWTFIKEHISSLPLKDDLTDEEFNELKTNFNIPSIGKLSCTLPRYRGMKNRYEIISKLRNDYNNKESETSI